MEIKGREEAEEIGEIGARMEMRRGENGEIEARMEIRRGENGEIGAKDRKMGSGVVEDCGTAGPGAGGMRREFRSVAYYQGSRNDLQLTVREMTGPRPGPTLLSASQE